jgi:hypothetical protein
VYIPAHTHTYLHGVVAGVDVGPQVQEHCQLLLTEPQAPQVVRCLTDGPEEVAALVAERDPARELFW